MKGLNKKNVWLIVGVITFFILIWKMGFQETGVALYQMHLDLFFIGFVFSTVGLIALFVKWVILCRSAHLTLSVREILFIFSKIMLFGTITPGRTGEFLTVLTSKESKGTVSAIILFNRIVESSVTLFLAILAFGLFFRNFIPRTSWFLIFLACIGVVGLVAMLQVKSFGLIVLRAVRKVMGLFIRYRFVEDLLSKENRFLKEFENFHTSIKQLFSLRILLFALVVTVFVWLLTLVANRFIFLAVGIHLPFLILLAFVPLFAISAFVSPAPGGIGIGDIPPVYFLYWAGYQENIGGYLVLSKILLYWLMGSLYFVSLLIQKTQRNEFKSPFGG